MHGCAITQRLLCRTTRGDLEPLAGLDLIYAVAWLRTVLQINLLLDLGIPQGKVGGLVFTAYEGGRKMPLADYRDE